MESALTYNGKIFSASIIEEIKKHALEVYPDECCGVIVNDLYYPLENIAENPKKDFKFPKTGWPLAGKFQAIIHSHPNGTVEPSIKDMEEMLRTPNQVWGICTTDGETVSDVVFYGDLIPDVPLMNRQFRSGPSGTDGKGDCYALIRDYYWLELGIRLKEFPRTDDWYTNKESPGNMYVEGFEQTGFKRISESELLPGDVILLEINTIKSGCPNHAGIFLGWKEGVLHHFRAPYLSKKDPMSRYHKYMTYFLRHESHNASV